MINKKKYFFIDFDGVIKDSISVKTKAFEKLQKSMINANKSANLLPSS